MKKLALATVFMLAALGMPRAASAAPIVSIVPGFQSGNVGDTFSVDVIISELLGASVGSFDLDITFNNAILLGQTLTVSDELGDPDLLEALDLSTGFAGGNVDIAVVSLLSAADLLSRQGGVSFTLATLTFQGLAGGISPLTIAQAIFADGDGNELAVGTANGSIEIKAPVNTVAEPATLLLLGLGTAATAAFRRRRAA